METYTYTIRTGWTPAPPDLALPPYLEDGEDLADWLCDRGYRILAESGVGRCGVGSFHVWHAETPAADGPRYAIQIGQLDADGVVWIAALPDLWDFLRLYGGIGFAMHRLLEGDGPPLCPDCGEPMSCGETPADDDPAYDA